MLVLLSPSKTLDETPVRLPVKPTQPPFPEETQQLAAILKKLKAKQLQKLMGVSEKIAKLNEARYQQFSFPFTEKNAKPALFMFKGDVYTPIAVDKYTKQDLEYAQAHLRMLSGFYGLLRPLDLMQPYRLEMGTELKNPKGKDLYAFWGEKIAAEINKAAKAARSKAVVNLASGEYFNAVMVDKLALPLVDVQFKEYRDGSYKIIGLLAKKARGMMADWIIRERVENPEKLKDFNLEGYRFAREMSSKDAMSFVRRESGKKNAA